MMQIYYIDNIAPSSCVHTCNTIKEAKKWVQTQIKGLTQLGPDNPCSEEELQSSLVGKYEVYNGAPVSINEKDELEFASPVYESVYFYTNDLVG